MYNILDSAGSFQAGGQNTSAIRGFASLGCFSDSIGPYAGHNMPQLFANDSMTPDLCISSAVAQLSAMPATTYLWAGVEYGRECYAGTVAPTPEPSALEGSGACTMACKGDEHEICGGPAMLNLYVVTRLAGVTGTESDVWSSTPATRTAVP